MARYLFTVPPLTGHLNPALSVASVLSSEGHEIAWAVHDDIRAKLPDSARCFSLGLAPVLTRNEQAAQVKGLESVRLFFEDYSLPMARDALPMLDMACRVFEPDLMVVDHQMLAGALVARKHGCPWVSLVTTTASILRMSPMLDAWVEEQLLHLQRIYLPSRLQVARPDLSPQQVIVFSLETLVGDQHPRLEAPYVFVGVPRGVGRQPIAFPWHWLRPELPKLLVSLGTVSRDRDTRFFEVIMEAVRDMPIQVIMVAPAVMAAQAPDHVLVCDYIPQPELLPHMDAVICHAGHNTVCESLAQGLPLIVAPIRDDQPVIARQVIDAGAGIFMRYGKVSVSMARQAIEQILTDTALKASAQRLASLFNAVPGEVQAAKLMMERVSSRSALRSGVL